MASEARFKIGDAVERAEPRSYRFPGVVIGANLKLDGRTWLYSVECVAPGVEGMVHEFTERALQARDASEIISEAAIRADQAERDATVGYVTCAETRHVRLGDAVRNAIRQKGSDDAG